MCFCSAIGAISLPMLVYSSLVLAHTINPATRSLGLEIPFSVIPGAFVGFALSVPFKIAEVCENEDLFVRLFFLLVVASLAAGALVGFVVGMLAAVPTLAWLSSINPMFPYLSQYDDYRKARDLIAITSGVIVAIALAVYTVSIARKRIGFREQSDGHQAADQPL